MTNEEKILELLEKHSEMFIQITGRLDQMQPTQAQMQIAQAQMQEDIHRINARLDFDVEKRFDAVNEGIDTILERLTPKSRVDELEADVIVLKNRCQGAVPGGCRAEESPIVR